MERYMYKAHIKPDCEGQFLAAIKRDQERIINGMRLEGIITFSLFKHVDSLYIYMEAPADYKELFWKADYTQWLCRWPGEPTDRYSVRMTDIFHYHKPDNPEEWRGERKIEKRLGALAQIKPEMFSSYVFYHYQLQEERPGSGNKTYIIGSHERYLFSYQELPVSIVAARPGLLSTRNSPADWGTLMHPHFEPWTDGNEDQKYWRAMELLISF